MWATTTDVVSAQWIGISLSRDKIVAMNSHLTATRRLRRKTILTALLPSIEKLPAADMAEVLRGSLKQRPDFRAGLLKRNIMFHGVTLDDACRKFGIEKSCLLETFFDPDRNSFNSCRVQLGVTYVC
jgi:hypothetical protein